MFFRIRTENLREPDGVEHVRLSKTVQGCALSMVKMIDRYLKGQVTGIEKSPLYEPSDIVNIDNPNPLRKPNVDLTDIYNVRKFYKSRVLEMKEKLHSDMQDLFKSKKADSAEPAPTA